MQHSQERCNRSWQMLLLLLYTFCWGKLSICLDLTQKLCVIIMIKVPVCGTDRQTGRLTVRWVGEWVNTLGATTLANTLVLVATLTGESLQLQAILCGAFGRTTSPPRLPHSLSAIFPMQSYVCGAQSRCGRVGFA